jgi:ferredoxin
MKLFYFTSTGNSLSVAKAIANPDDELISIPQIKNGQSSFKADVIGIITPIYAFACPMIVKKFLASSTFETNYLFLIGTYGCKAGGFCLNTQKLLKKQGINLDYANTIKMVDNHLGLFEMDAERALLPSKNVNDHLSRIINDIKQQKPFVALTLREERFMNFIMNSLSFLDSSKNAAKRIKIDNTCTKCGICLKVCPCKNITIKEKAVIGNYCTKCMGCIHHCPVGAIHLINEKSTARWRNPDVSLKEIIESNNQL